MKITNPALIIITFVSIFSRLASESKERNFVLRKENFQMALDQMFRESREVCLLGSSGYDIPDSKELKNMVILLISGAVEKKTSEGVIRL